MLTAEDIWEEFEKVRGAVDYRSVTDPELRKHDPYFESPIGGPAIKRNLDRIGDLLESHPRFAKRFDFGWATDPASYGESFEVTLQMIVIAALCDSNQDHPGLRRLKPTVVRCVLNPQFSSTCLEGSDVDFICISNGFMKFLQILIGSLIDFHDSGAELSGETRLSRTNYFFGQDAERTLRENPERGLQICAAIVGSGFRICEGDFVGHHSPIASRLEGDVFDLSPMMALAYPACEGFVVCHELAHLLRGHRYSIYRSIEQEVEADEAAASLMIVAGAVLGNSLPAAPIYGPAVFFQAARIFELIRRMRSLIDEKDVPPDQIPDQHLLAGQEHELSLRTKLTWRYLDQAMPTAPPIYHDVCRELAVVIVGCQQFFFKTMIKEERDFDELFTVE